MNVRFRYLATLCALWLMIPRAWAQENTVATRIKDLVEIRGVRANPLVGYGLVVGLAGTGDSPKSLATNRAISHLLSRLGTPVNAQQVLTKNTAAVIVTSELTPFARIGDKLEVRISSIGDATSLEGGTLILTPLSAADAQVYAVAQGPISQGTAMAGSEGGGAAKSTAPKTVALGKFATVEREFATRFMNGGVIELSLLNADFTTANRISQAINEQFGEFIATPQNAGLIKLQVPTSATQNPSFTPVAFVSAIEQIRVAADSKATIVINERTGTIIAGENVTIAEVAISHGNLQITITGKNNPSAKVGNFKGTTSVGDLAKALNALGAGPKDLVAILQSLEASKALRAQIKTL